jgi:hypothetical protein
MKDAVDRSWYYYRMDSLYMKALDEETVKEESVKLTTMRTSNHEQFMRWQARIALLRDPTITVDIVMAIIYEEYDDTESTD